MIRAVSTAVAVAMLLTAALPNRSHAQCPQDAVKASQPLSLDSRSTPVHISLPIPDTQTPPAPRADAAAGANAASDIAADPPPTTAREDSTAGTPEIPGKAVGGSGLTEPPEPRVDLVVSFDRVETGAIVLLVQRAETAERIATLCIPAETRGFGVSRIEVHQDQDGLPSGDTLRVKPFAPTSAEIRIHANHLLEGTEVEMPGFENFKVDSVRIWSESKMSAFVRIDPSPIHELPIGRHELRLYHELGEERVAIVVMGPKPQVPDRQVVEVNDGLTTVAVKGTNLARGATVRITPHAGYDVEPFFLPVMNGTIQPLTVNLPPLPGPSASAEVTATNPDGKTTTTTLVLRRSAEPTLEVEPKRVWFGEPRRFEFHPLNESIVLQNADTDRYVVRVSGLEVRLTDPRVDPEGRSLSGRAQLPDSLPALTNAEFRARVTLSGPGIHDTLVGSITIAPRSSVSPKFIRLRPGEERLVTFNGVYLSGASLQSKEPARVVQERWGNRSGTVLFRAATTAAPGTVDTLDLDRNGTRVAHVVVRIVPWADGNAIVSALRYATGDGTWRALADESPHTIPPSSELRLRLDSIAGLALPQPVRARLEKGGTVLWADTVEIEPGMAANFKKAFDPGDTDELGPGGTFMLIVESEGGVHIRRRFRMDYEGTFLRVLDDVQPVSGISTLQIPWTDGHTPDVFNGVVLGAGFRIAPVSRLFKSDVVRFVVLGSASVVESDAGAEAAETDTSKSLAFGGSVGILLAKTFYLTVGGDSGGDGPRRWYFSVGTAASFADLTQLIKP